MGNLEKQQAFKLSDYFHQLGNTVGEYIQDNKSNFSDTERNALFDYQIALLQAAGRINIIGVSLISDSTDDLLQQLDVVTISIKKTVKKALAIQTIIDLAAMAADIGTAILSRDLQLALDTTEKLITTLKKLNEK